MRKTLFLLSMILTVGCLCIGCGAKNEDTSNQTVEETETKEVEVVELTLENWQEYFDINTNSYRLLLDEFDEITDFEQGVTIYLKEEYANKITDNCDISEIAFKTEGIRVPMIITVDEETLEVVFGEPRPDIESISQERTDHLRNYKVEEQSRVIHSNPNTIRADFQECTRVVFYGYGDVEYRLMYMDVKVTNVKGTLEFYK